MIFEGTEKEFGAWKTVAMMLRKITSNLSSTRTFGNCVDLRTRDPIEHNNCKGPLIKFTGKWYDICHTVT